MIWRLLCFNYVVIHIYSTTAQLSQTETLRNITACDLNVAIPVTCATDEIITVHSLQYAYNVGCGGTCCPYTSTDCFVNADNTDIQDIRRVCSGKSSCNVQISADKADFATCSLGVLDISYVFLQYYCIPNDRISSICTSGQTITSDGAPLYLTNDNYPSVTTGSTSCSCSLEVYSCSSSINLYTVDADLYLDTSTCLQNLNFLNGLDQTLQTIGCESHYLDQIEINTVNSHYLKVDFINNSTANQEGYFFIGLEASESGASFSLSCNHEQETWCIGCGAVPDITHGQVALSNVNDSSYEATATVTCDSGYETQTPAIKCLANGSWPVPVCTLKDCGSVPSISNGVITTDNSTIGSVADVTCAEGYNPSAPHVTCPTSGSWETASCTAKDCGSVPSISNGNITTDNSTIGSVADVTCAEGYNPSAPHVTCLTSGSWETASCTAKDCGSVPSISNGNITTDNSTIGSVADVTCAEGYNPSAPHVTCLTSGSWETASCTAKDCGSVPSISNGNITTDNSTIGSVADVTCAEGYNPSAPHVTCLTSGSWETASCTAKDCGSVPSISNGNITTDNSTIGSVADVTCAEGYNPSAPNVTCLTSGSWEIASCTAKDCGSVPSISNGNITTDNSTIGSVADVTCTEGYNPSVPNVTCLTSGSWETASCTAKETNGTDGNGEDNSGNTDESKEKEGGLAAWVIAVIVIAVIAVVLVVIAVGVALYVKCIKNQDITPEDNERKLPLGNQNADSVQPQIVPTEESNVFSKSKPLPEITKQHEISHGHVYIDHGDAHIFGITIHLPFGKKPANRLTPIQRAEND